MILYSNMSLKPVNVSGLKLVYQIKPVCIPENEHFKVYHQVYEMVQDRKRHENFSLTSEKEFLEGWLPISET